MEPSNESDGDELRSIRVTQDADQFTDEATAATERLTEELQLPKKLVR